MGNNSDLTLGLLSDAVLNGKTFKINDPNPNAAAVVGRTSFSADQPSLMVHSAVGQNKRKLCSYISLEQKTPVAGGDIEILTFIDTVNRLSTGGNRNDQIALKNPHLQGIADLARDFDFSVNPTLNVAGSSKLTLVDRSTYPAIVGSVIELDVDEDWLISPGGAGSLMIWIISPTTGLSFKHHIEVIQS